MQDRRVVLVIGGTAIARRVCATLTDECSGRSVVHRIAPTDDQLQRAISAGVEGAAILLHDDVLALRYALAIAHLNRQLALVVTIFDKTIAEQLREFLPQAAVVSPAELAAPSLVGPCLGSAVLASFRTAEGADHVIRQPRGLVTVTETPRRRLLRRLPATCFRLGNQPPGNRLLLLGLAGLACVLAADWLWLVLAERRDPVRSFLDAARVVATVGPADGHGSARYAMFSGVAMLLTILFTALFTAGVVDRLVRPPYAGLFGRRAVARDNHVVVVGMGQVGIRLCIELRAHGLRVVGVERTEDAPLLPLARALGIPVVIGDGTDRRVLERLRLHRCPALASVASDELQNIAVAVSAAAISPATRVVLRAGEQEAISETRSLLPLGVTRDVTAIAAGFVVAHLRGQQPHGIVAGSTTIHVRHSEGRLETIVMSRSEDCCHLPLPEVADRQRNLAGPGDRPVRR